jgi:hypothetical protein
MNIRLRKIAALLAGAIAVTLPTITGAEALMTGPLTCGQTITESWNLTVPVGPCANNGIIIGADNITLNLNGFRVFGTAGISGDGAGVLLQNRTGVTVQNGEVTDFDGGVVILGGSTNTVTAIRARNNLGRVNETTGPTALYGDGIRVFGLGNTIDGNTTNQNRAAGISVGRRTGQFGSFPATNPNGRNNVLRNNSAFGNVVFDLWDSNRLPDCDNNLWTGNKAANVSPPCTLNP